jgi:hypothetical protein
VISVTDPYGRIPGFLDRMIILRVVINREMESDTDNLFGFRQSQLYFSNVFYYNCYMPTTCFGSCGPSSGGIYVCILVVVIDETGCNPKKKS